MHCKNNCIYIYVYLFIHIEFGIWIHLCFYLFLLCQLTVFPLQSNVCLKNEKLTFLTTTEMFRSAWRTPAVTQQSSSPVYHQLVTTQYISVAQGVGSQSSYGCGLVNVRPCCCAVVGLVLSVQLDLLQTVCGGLWAMFSQHWFHLHLCFLIKFIAEGLNLPKDLGVGNEYETVCIGLSASHDQPWYILFCSSQLKFLED